MRKFLLMLLVVLTMPAFAQGDYQYRISTYMSIDGFETYNYNYSDVLGTDLQSIHKIDLTEQMELIDTLVYDEEGRIISIQTHQLFDYGWRKVCWIDYTYNEMGLRATRKNYNDFGDGFGGILGGTYYYSYDDEGRMTRRELEFDNYLFEIIEFHYNDKGQLEAEVAKQDSFTGTFENSLLKEYYYDDNGNQITTMIYYWSYDWYLQMSFMQEYDEVGNCIKAKTFSAEGVAQEQRVYEYDMEVSNDDVYHFPNPEGGYPTLPQMKNKLESYEHWAVNQNTNQLVYLRDYLFLYDVISDDDDDDDNDNDTTSVANNYSIKAQIYPNPVSDNVMIESEEADYVQLLDICGRELFATEVRGTTTIDMKEYEAGIYFVRLHSNGSTSVQKVVKK